ncbi:MAG: FixH family protein [Hyphomonadaceae bacterium]|jgi:nitrogen fixation protein FixH|nr:FixH family protein [Hyphomonadaceae bacterium]
MTALAHPLRPDPARPVRILKGWHVFAIFAAMFGVIIAVNATFITLALKTFSGESDHAYMEGLRFNEQIAANHVQAAQGWTMKLSMARGAGGDARFTASLRDAAGDPVTGVAMTGLVGRPTSDGQDRPLTFSEEAPGEYVAGVDRLGPGRWLFAVEATRDGDAPFKAETRVSLR